MVKLCNEAKAFGSLPADLRERAEKELATVRLLVEQQVNDPFAAIPVLRVALESEKGELEDKTEAVRFLTAQGSSWERLEGQIEELGQTIPKLETRVAEFQKELSAFEPSLEKLSAADSWHSSLLEALEAIVLETVRWRHELEDWLQEWTELPLEKEATREIRIGAVKHALEGLEREYAEAHSRHELLTRCCEELPVWQRIYAERSKETERVAKLRRKLESAEALSEIQRDLENLVERREQIIEEQDEMGNALDRLRLLLGAEGDPKGRGEDSLAADGATELSQCPLCGHDHDSPNTLKLEISRVVESAPKALRFRSRKVESIQKEIATHHSRLKEQDQLEQEIARREKQQKQRAAVLKDAIELLEEALLESVTESGLERPNLDSYLKGCRKDVERTLEENRTKAGAARREVELGAKLKSAGLALVQLFERSAQIVAKDLTPIEYSVPRKWLDQLTELEAAIKQAQQVATENLAKAAAKKSTLMQERSVAQDRHDTTNQELRSSQGDLEQALEKFEILVEKWRVLGAPGTSPDEHALTLARRNLRKQTAAVDRAEAALEKASRFLSEADKSEKAHKDIESRTERLADSSRRRDGLQAWVDDLKTARQMLEAEQRKYIQEEIEPLSGLISAIFRRAQSNEVVDRIEHRLQGGDDGELLNWRPRIGRQELAVSQLSLGQRQDLALAVFLARARSLGGSFFLDEPLIHLDDLNRVALLDTFRVLALDAMTAGSEGREILELRLVITTASSTLMRHFREKFSLVPRNQDVPPLRIYELSGNPRRGIQKREIQVPEAAGEVS